MDITHKHRINPDRDIRKVDIAVRVGDSIKAMHETIYLQMQALEEMQENIDVLEKKLEDAEQRWRRWFR